VQPLDPSGAYPDAEVIDALVARGGARTMTYRYDRLDSACTYLGPLANVLGGQVSNNALGTIKRTARFSMLETGELNYLSDLVRPYARLSMPDGGFAEWPLGTFSLSTPDRSLDEVGIVTRDVEAYDLLVVLNDDKVTDRYSVAAGVAYTTALAAVAAGAGLAYAITPSALTLPAAMEWEPGTTKLRIVNDLLAAINYESATIDELGVLICRPYQSPQTRATEYTYADGAASVRRGGARQGLDLFAVANRWTLVKSEPDQAALISTYTNADPLSPTSTVSRGRTIVDFRTEQDAADQSTLDAKAARLAFEASQVFEAVSFDTAAMPMHSDADLLRLELPGLAVAARYVEQTWTLPLSTGATMKHKARRVVTV
jgi:hypothetical protein